MKNLICKKCGHKETLENINYSATSKILIAQVPRVRKIDGLDIYPLYCLKCNFITEWAADPNNISGKAVEGVEYFKTFKINKKYKEYFADIEDNLVSTPEVPFTFPGGTFGPIFGRNCSVHDAIVKVFSVSLL